MNILKSLLHKKAPGQLVVQFTDRCNASCPQCGMRRTEKFPRSKLAIDNVKRMIDNAAQKGFQAMSFTGGEPLLYLDEVILLIQYAGEAGIPFIRTGTNGFLFMNSHWHDFKSRMERLADRLARTSLRTFWISIDSADALVHEQMRGLPGVIRGIEKALPIFHEYGLYPAANLGINRNLLGGNANVAIDHDPDGFLEVYREGFRNFYKFVINLGFTISNSCYPMSIDDNKPEDELSAVYAATSRDNIVRFTRKEKLLIFRALFETIPEFRDKIRIFSPRTSLYSLIRKYNGNHRDDSYPCLGGIDFFFIDAQNGDTFPCGYRGKDNFGKLSDVDIDASNWQDAYCRQCDWECFRDPSELLGPIIHAISDFPGLAVKLLNNRQYLPLWLDDLMYYYACDFFNGRKPCDARKLKNFSQSNS